MNIINKIYCWLFGHDMIMEGCSNNHSSLFGSYRCLRCGLIHNWQYDL